MNRFKFLDLLLFALLFVFVNAFPVDLITADINVRLILRISLRLLLLGYDIYLLIKNRINIFKFANYRRGLLFLPFILVCFSNLIAAGISQTPMAYVVDPVYLSLICVYHLVGVVIEELLFRLFIQRSLVYASSLKRILVSAGIFALFHLLNIVDVSSVEMLINVLIQVVYAFGLGILLGFIYEYTYSIPLCVVFHLIFNFFNTIFVENIYFVNFSNNLLTYYLTAVISGLVVGIYTLLIYLFVLRRNERYFRE